MLLLPSLFIIAELVCFSVPIVPVCSFGETNAYDQITFPEGSFMKKVINFIRKIMGLPAVFFIGRGFFQNYFGLIPRQTPITVVGEYFKARKIVYQYGSTNNIIGQ